MHEIAIGRVIDHEGGYVDHPDDPGGETNYGITIATARNFGYTGEMRDLPLSVAVDIYKQLYWDTISADEMPFSVAFQVFDGGVNHGIKRSVRWLQESIGATPDGIVGAQTIEYVNREQEHDVVLTYNAQRIQFYTSLQTFKTFGRGWMRRVAQNLEYATFDLE